MLIGPIYAMARPARPAAERDAVRAGAAGAGSAICRAQRLARAVVLATMAEIDRDPADDVIGVLVALDPSPVAQLATNPEIDTAALILAERVRRLDARGGRRLAEADWATEDREIALIVSEILAQRYRRLLQNSWQKPGFRQTS